LKSIKELKKGWHTYASYSDPRFDFHLRSKRNMRLHPSVEPTSLSFLAGPTHKSYRKSIKARNERLQDPAMKAPFYGETHVAGRFSTSRSLCFHWESAKRSSTFKRVLSYRRAEVRYSEGRRAAVNTGWKTLIHLLSEGLQGIHTCNFQIVKPVFRLAPPRSKYSGVFMLSGFEFSASC